MSINTSHTYVCVRKYNHTRMLTNINTPRRNVVLSLAATAVNDNRNGCLVFVHQCGWYDNMDEINLYMPVNKLFCDVWKHSTLYVIGQHCFSFIQRHCKLWECVYNWSSERNYINLPTLTETTEIIYPKVCPHHDTRVVTYTYIKYDLIFGVNLFEIYLKVKN